MIKEGSNKGAEQISEREPMEVPVEKMIPNIDLNMQQEYLDDRAIIIEIETIHADEMSPDIPQKDFILKYEEVKDDSQEIIKLKNEYPANYALMQFKDQIVVDLGGSNAKGYEYVSDAGAKGYIAVDKYNSMKHNDVETFPFLMMKRKFNTSESAPPVSIIKKDMLDFLRSLPDNSVSIILSGIEFYHTSIAEFYRKDLEKEIKRVLNPEGALIVSGLEAIKPDLTEVVAKRGLGKFMIMYKKEEEKIKK